jgi:hypothetical protein
MHRRTRREEAGLPEQEGVERARAAVLIAPDKIDHNEDGAVIPSQNACRRSTRFAGAFPAMIAALIAPIEMPATQSGKYRDVERAS